MEVVMLERSFKPRFSLRRELRYIWRVKIMIPLKSLFPRWRQVTWGPVPRDHDWQVDRSPLRGRAA
jgi:hypothetical protein